MSSDELHFDGVSAEETPFEIGNFVFLKKRIGNLVFKLRKFFGEERIIELIMVRYILMMLFYLTHYISQAVVIVFILMMYFASGFCVF